jgi:diaminopimelate epimerase
MHYFNSDGSEAAFCGNGARCLVRYCAVKGVAEPPLEFRTGSALHRGELAGSGVKVDMEMPALVRQTTVCIDRREYRVHLVDAGVPHAVILTDNVGSIDVEAAGRKIRWDSEFQPQGANVDFVERSAGAPFALRTYERGVEKETLACGSGCLAAALVLNLSGLAGEPVELKAASGDVLTVGLARHAYLAGPATIVYEGEVEAGEV